MSNNIVTSKLKQILRSIGESTFQQKGFFETTVVVFFVALFFQIISQWFSFESELEFFANQFFAPDDENRYAKAIAVGIVFEVMKATAISAAFVAFFNGKQKAFWLAIVGLGFSYGSWWMSDQGTYYMGEAQAGAAPTDARSAQVESRYKPQLDQLAKEKDELEATNFYWCSEHVANHKCPSAQYYVNKAESSDKKALIRIAEITMLSDSLRKDMNAQLKNAETLFLGETDQFNKKKQRILIGLQWKVLGAEIVSWMCLGFIFYFYYRITQDDEENEDHEDDEDEAGQEPFMLTDEELLIALGDDPLRKEELKATIEARRAGKQIDQSLKKKKVKK